MKKNILTQTFAIKMRSNKGIKQNQDKRPVTVRRIATQRSWAIVCSKNGGCGQKVRKTPFLKWIQKDKLHCIGTADWCAAT